jgi:hypothetical protein
MNTDQDSPTQIQTPTQMTLPVHDGFWIWNGNEFVEKNNFLQRVLTAG